MNYFLNILVIVFGFLNVFANAQANNEASQGEQRVSKTGAVFIRDNNHKQLGEAYRDPSGLIWGELISGTMDYARGWQECKARGARLPTDEEFNQLREFLGWLPEKNENYDPFMEDGNQVLPALADSVWWSNTAFYDFANRGSVFNGSLGDIWGPYRTTIYLFQEYSVRCVKDAADLDSKMSPPAEKRYSYSTNAIFIRDHSNPQLGEAYRDRKGLIWGDVISDSMAQSEAIEACKAINARLPSYRDYKFLAESLGYGSPQGYSPYAKDEETMILPHFLSDGWFFNSKSYWSSSDYDYFGTLKGIIFHSGTVSTVLGAKDKNEKLYVRCVSN